MLVTALSIKQKVVIMMQCDAVALTAKEVKIIRHILWNI